MSATSRASRARLAALSRYRRADDPERVEADRAHRELMLAEHIRETVDTWPPLTGEQRDRLAALLRRPS